ncbi:hypothetical protein NECID01_0785 [Nematocida sp. AWRm77]|nr:hypothetical protein NECID01_0785 [Nematocida sp. AWRm77]
MRVRIPLHLSANALVVRLPLCKPSTEDAPKTSLSSLVQNRMKYLLNAIYGILSSDLKEQEKRRRIIRLYAKESSELTTVLGLCVSAKYLKDISSLESKTFSLQRYNTEQESLADQLVYKWNELRMEASSSYSVGTAIDVLFRKTTNFPAAVPALAKALQMTKKQAPDFSRIEQILRMHVQKAGLWKEKDVSVGFKDGTVVVESFGFRSVLVLVPAPDGLRWHLLQISPLQSGGKGITPRMIKGENLLKEVVSVTKYTATVLEIEEIYKTLKDKSDKKLFDISLTGTSRAFKATLFGLYRVEARIKKSWNGPSLYCVLEHMHEAVVFKENVAESLSAHIDLCLKKEYDVHVSFSVGRGLMYKEVPVVYLRELQKEYLQEQTAHKALQIPGLMLQENANIWVQESVLQVNLYIKEPSGVYLGLLWNASQTSVRVFYGVHGMEEIPPGEEIPVNTEGVLFIETKHTPRQIIKMILAHAGIVLVYLGTQRDLRQFKHVQSRLSLEKEPEFMVCSTISVKCEEKQPGVYLTEILGPMLALKTKMDGAEVQRNLWIAVLVLGIIGHVQVKVPELFSSVIISGSVNRYPKQKTDGEISLQYKTLQMTFTYLCKHLQCGAPSPLVHAWVNSAVASKSLARLENTFCQEELLQHSGLISTIPVQGVLGGSLALTCRTSIIYRCGAEIELYWTGGKNGAVDRAFSTLKKIKEGPGSMSFRKEDLEPFLAIINDLLSQERIAVLGRKFAVSRNGKAMGTYRLVYNEGLVCTKVEGRSIEDVITLIEKSPDVEKDLASLGYSILPNLE